MKGKCECVSGRVKAPIEASVLNRFTEMLRHNIGTSRQIRNGPRHFQNSVVRPGRQTKPIHRHLQQVCTLAVDLTKLFDFLRFHVCVGEKAFSSFEPLRLAFPRLYNSLSDHARAFSTPFRGQLDIFDRLHFDVYIDPIKKRS